MSRLEMRQEGSACLRDRLLEENQAFGGTGGVSPLNREHGFLPAFCDTDTGVVYPSLYADGRPAPVHLYEGLPSALVVDLGAGNKLKVLKSSVVAGFVRGQRFYTRDEAARVLDQSDAVSGCRGRRRYPQPVEHRSSAQENINRPLASTMAQIRICEFCSSTEPGMSIRLPAEAGKTPGLWGQLWLRQAPTVPWSLYLSGGPNQ